MLEDGYAAVSSRSVAARVGINAPLVHYYFPTLDDLFIAVLERRAGPNVDRLTDALDSDQPLLTWWKLASNRRGAALFVELMAAANHRPLLKAGVEPQDDRAMAHSPAELQLLLDESAGHGALAAEEHALLTRSLELSGLTAADAMTARRDIVAVAAGVTVEVAAAEAHRTGRSRVVVHEGDLDHVRGFVHVKDLLTLPDGSWSTTLVGDVARPILVTPERHRLEDLLLELPAGREHIGLVVDEHGTVVGVVTLEDVIEELIGDFDDESDRRDGDCLTLADGSFSVSGAVRVDQFEDWVGVELPDGDWHTLAGYVIAAFDEIPAVGDHVTTEVGMFEVLAMDGFAIDRVRVRPTAHDPR